MFSSSLNWKMMFLWNGKGGMCAGVREERRQGVPFVVGSTSGNQM